MDELIRKRDIVRSRLGALGTWVDALNLASVDQYQLQIKSQRIDDCQKESIIIQDQIDALVTDDANYKKQVQVRIDFEAYVDKYKAKLLRLMTPTTTATTKAPSQIRLPKLDLPTFDGDIQQWASFRDIFIASVHNSNLSDSAKLSYLKTKLTGEAARLVKSFTLTDVNYNIAWIQLDQRYDNNRELLFSILKRFVGQPALHGNSAIALRTMIDVSNECIQSLKGLKVPVEHWDAIIMFHLFQKLDNHSKELWEERLPDSSIPTLSQFLDFLEQRARGLAATSNNKSHGSRGEFGPSKKVSVNLSQSSPGCVLCKGNHPLHKCSSFSERTVHERYEIVKTNALCFDCLRGGHSSNKCNSSSSCRTCNSKHHSMLHFDKQVQSKESKDDRPEEPVLGNHASNDHGLTQSILATALVKVLNFHGRQQTLRAMLDGGSTSSFVTEDAFRRLGIQKGRNSVKIVGIASTPAGVAKGITTLEVSPHFDSNIKPYLFNCLILPRVTGRLPTRKLDTTSWPHLQGLLLADPSYHKPSTIDILLGSDIFWNTIQDGKREGPSNAPVGIKSSLGWLIAGKVDSHTPDVQAHLSDIDLDNRLQSFWEIESISTARSFTGDEQICEDHFEATHARNDDGRFVVKLPFKHLMPSLGSSRELAVRRLNQLERRLASKPEYSAEYKKFMTEYLQMGHMEPVPADQITKPLNPTCFIPHHFVLKESSTSTKFRVVFDASMQTATGLSLNHSLLVGPTIQDNLIDILMRFRTHPIAFTADVAKMYRQILVTAPDADMQRIVWRDDPSKPIAEYRLLTVTYETASAPYLATKALQQLAIDGQEAYPIGSEVARKDFYVDDVMSGDLSVPQAIEKRQQLHSLLMTGHLPLMKYCSNSQEFMSSIPLELRQSKFLMPMDFDQSVKALGIIWNTTTDEFMFKLTLDVSSHDFQLTKRRLLSEIAKIFDPLGWLAPIIIRAKILLQDLWKLELGWDDILPEKIQKYWYSYRDNLHHVEDFRISRCLTPSSYVQVHLIGFSDASVKGYAGVMYTCAYFSDRDPVISLVSSKTRVAPVKSVSVPRLELCGALLLSQLMTNTIAALNVTFHNISCWTDSTVVLAWLRDHPSRLKTYVANRVTEIQDLFPSKFWGHVSGIDNPADCASRGLDPSALKNHPLWLNGPKWLQDGKPIASNDNPDWQLVLEEEKKLKPVSMITIPSDEEFIWHRFSTMRRLTRVTAWILRFRELCISKMLQKKGTLAASPGGPLTVSELYNSTCILVRFAQQQVFHDEIQKLDQKLPLAKKSRILPLNPFLDGNKILRVGGRLRHARIPADQKNPMLLPRNHRLTELIINQFHIDHFHAGPQLLLACIQQQFWIPCGRDAIRQYLRRCVVCTRHSATMMTQMMGDLPEARVNPARSFLKCGVDYAGPFLFKSILSRSKVTLKAYLSIFVCFVTHAVHLEVVTALSTDAFLAALKRFVSRRGRPSDIYSDCGTNFVGAARELKEITAFQNSSSHNDKMVKEVSNDGLTWHFNPPGAPHFGGLWEAGVKSVKYHLTRIMGTQKLNFEELTTIMTQIEAILNSRPLTPVSTNPQDLQALTPGHFLIGTSLTAVPEYDLTPENENRLNRWQLLQHMQQLFWQRWSSEYISRLQQRPKWLQQRNEICCEDLVIIKDDRYPPLQWKLGRVIALHPGADGITRVVTLRTSDGELKRPLAKICLLPVENKSESVE